MITVLSDACDCRVEQRMGKKRVLYNNEIKYITLFLSISKIVEYLVCIFSLVVYCRLFVLTFCLILLVLWMEFRLETEYGLNYSDNFHFSILQTDFQFDINFNMVLFTGNSKTVEIICFYYYIIM